jgi:peptide/nickel transport system ATP-binding protein
MALLEVKDLVVRINTEDGVVKAVDGLSFTLERGKALGIVGESGSGKSVSALTLMGLSRFFGDVSISGQVLLDGEDLLAIPEQELRKRRGNQLAMIFQDPLSSLHPFFRVGDQLVEAVRAHRTVSRTAARTRALELLRLVGIPEAEHRIDAFPHQFSGGMRQRVMIAMAICNDPGVLIADEPTTALDVTMQAQILELVEQLQEQLGMAVILITHDLGLVAELADDVLVMYAGRAVEYGPTLGLFEAPEHPYTWGLLRSIPRLDIPRREPLVPINGRPPSLIVRPSGCPFHPRCEHTLPDCLRIEPALVPVEADDKHTAACNLPSNQRRQLWQELRPLTQATNEGMRAAR